MASSVSPWQVGGPPPRQDRSLGTGALVEPPGAQQCQAPREQTLQLGLGAALTHVSPVVLARRDLRADGQSDQLSVLVGLDGALCAAAAAPTVPQPRDRRLRARPGGRGQVALSTRD